MRDDLDHEAAAVCDKIGRPMARAQAVNEDAMFLDLMAGVVLRAWDRYRSGRLLPLAPLSTLLRVEGPPPFRARTRRE